MKAEGLNNINILNEKRNIKIKNIELNHERKNDEYNHKINMAIIEKNHIKGTKKFKDEHEINSSKQKNEIKKINVDIERNLIDSQEKNKRKYNLKLTQINSDNNATIKRLYTIKTQKINL